MTRNDIIGALRVYFKIDELVCPHTYAKFGENSWDFLDDKYLETLLIIRRDIIRSPMLCNNYNKGGAYSQRGLRCNCCELVKEKKQVYLSAHILGKGGDFSCTAFNAEQMRGLIEQKKNLLPYPIRVEQGVSWLHFDVQNFSQSLKIKYFNG